MAVQPDLGGARYPSGQIEEERRRRILVALWAYAYEIKDRSLVDDATFDRTCRLIDTSIKTGHPRLDAFFRLHFHPDTGQWVHRHPELARIGELYERGERMGWWATPAGGNP